MKTSISHYLAGKTIFITGATGFLGQPLIEKLLWSASDLRRIYVLIRPKMQLGGRVVGASERLEREVYDSSVFDRLRNRHDRAFEAFLREKLVAVAGDISQDNLGLEGEIHRRLRSDIDIVINSAAVVSFDAPLDEALELNVLGAHRLSLFAASCEDALLVHVSTAYVCGAATGDIHESLYHAKGGDGPRRISDWRAETERIRAVIKRVREEAYSPPVKEQLKEELKKRKKKRRRRGGGRKEKMDGLRELWLTGRLTEAGMTLARERGWNDTYTYTKAVGEQAVLEARGEVPTVLLRPSVIESSLSEPSPGWLDGLRMADPLIVAIGKGRLRSLPLDPEVNLDLVPVDFVVNALLAAIPHIAETGGLKIFQVATGSRNPVSLGRLYELIYEYFQKNPMLDRAGDPIRVRRLRFPNPSTFRIQHRLKAVPLDTAEKTLDRLAVFNSTHKARRKIAATRAAHERLYYYGEIYEPYLNLHCRFLIDNTEKLLGSLPEEERRAFNFDVSRLNWRHYIQNVHIPGVKKFILKIEGTGTLELEDTVARIAVADGTIFDLVCAQAEKLGAKTALQSKRDGEWTRYSYQELVDEARKIGRRFLQTGLRKGDRVILYSENQPEWGLAYLGAVSIGLVVVPLDSQSWHREVWSVANFTEARALLVSQHCWEIFTRAQLERNEKRPAPCFLFNVDQRCQPIENKDFPASTAPIFSEQEEPWPTVSPDDPASIVFTTSTAVDPKGAVHTHRNFLTNLLGVNYHLSVSEADQLLSVLPLYHALEFTCGLLMPLYGGATVTYSHSLKPKVLLDVMRETGTSCMLGVPTLYALIRDDIERRILGSAKSALKNNLFETSKQISRSLEKKFGKNIGQKLFSRVYEEFGGRIRIFVSGGSALGSQLYLDYKAMGLTIYEGYGLTETAPVLTVNPLHRSREGSAGKPLPGVELRLYHPDRDGVGEIIVRTPSLMREYFRNPEATEKVTKEGWFHTGDLGWVDADGYVYITGRIKDVIVTGAGKNVYPADLEAIYQELEIVDEICVFGVKSGLTEDVHAAVVPNDRSLEGVAGEERQKTVQKSLHQLGRELPSYHRLQAIHLVPGPLPKDQEGALCRAKIRDLALPRRDSRPQSRRFSKSKGLEAILLSELSRLSGEPPEEIGRDSHLYTDLGLDSLMALELLLSLEQQFGVSIPDREAARLQTVADILNEIRRRGIPLSDGDRRQDGSNGLPSVRPYTSRSSTNRALLGASFAAMKGLFSAYFKLQVQGGENLPREGAYILAANHSSHLDTGAIISAVSRAADARRLHVIGARDYFFNTPLKSWFFSTCLNVVPLERDEISLAGMRTIREILAAGEAILIFPEGTRSRTGELRRFKPGIGLIAWEERAPIVPVRISGTYEAMPAGKSFPRPSRVVVSFGNPVSPKDYTGCALPKDELYRQIARDVERSVEQLRSIHAP